MNNSTVIKRLGFLIDMLELHVSPLLYKQMKNSIGSGRSWLDPYSVKHKKSNLKWKLFVNVPLESLSEAKSAT